jgi:hypothetical protein
MKLSKRKIWRDYETNLDGNELSTCMSNNGV